MFFLCFLPLRPCVCVCVCVLLFLVVSLPGGVQPAGESAGLEGKRLHNLWAEVVRLAAKRQESTILRQAALIVRGVTWDVKLNREMVIQQADVDTLLAESLARDVNAAAATAAAARLGEEQEQEHEEDEEEDEEARKKV
jgi:hypothetical protein